MSIAPGGQPTANAATVELPRSEAPAPLGSLLQAILGSADSRAKSTQAASSLELFTRARLPGEALKHWIGDGLESARAEDVSSQLARDIAQIDLVLSRQVNEILHHARFQRLEAAWRGLAHLVSQAAAARDSIFSERHDAKVQIRVFHLPKSELWKNLDKASEFDQSVLFKRVYSDGFGTLGGEPTGVLICDYEFTKHPEDFEFLMKASGVAAAAFCPFIAGAAPELFDLDGFHWLAKPIKLSDVFNEPEYTTWQSFRESHDAQYVGLTLPRVLMRLPYDDDGSRRDGFRFIESVGADEAEDYNNYLWGNAAFAFGGVLVRAFCESRWFAEIRGLSRPAIAGGEVGGIDADWSRPEKRGLAPKSLTEVAIGEERLRELSELGMIPLCPTPHSPNAVFYTNASAHKPKRYVDPVATTNARISAMLQYVLCASRFAHYLKVIARNRLGSVADAEALEDFLKRWLSDYITNDALAPAETKARFPLRETRLEVKDKTGGHYQMVMHLLPHFQLDELHGAMELRTDITPGVK